MGWMRPPPQAAACTGSAFGDAQIRKYRHGHVEVLAFKDAAAPKKLAEITSLGRKAIERSELAEEVVVSVDDGLHEGLVE
jgi:hypothetical protein